VLRASFSKRFLTAGSTRMVKVVEGMSFQILYPIVFKIAQMDMDVTVRGWIFLTKSLAVTT
jgi:hypothetical protein